jgi:ribosomal protein S18 acetylase RimI-like enzyme
VERTVRQAGPGHASAVATLLAQAFNDDPVMHWMQPIPSRRPAALRRLFAAQLRHEYLPAGGVQLIGGPTGQPLAAAMWKPAGTTGPRASRREELTMTAAVVGALRTRLPVALTLRRALDGAHPAEPHWYLNKLGTAPTARGQGLASALLTAQARHCDETSTAAYLEATRHELIGFYEKFGFTCTAPIDVPHGGPAYGGCGALLAEPPRISSHTFSAGRRGVR